jgi:hypothetical protein
MKTKCMTYQEKQRWLDDRARYLVVQLMQLNPLDRMGIVDELKPKVDKLLCAMEAREENGK